jgi:hypothetical protein
VIVVVEAAGDDNDHVLLNVVHQPVFPGYRPRLYIAAEMLESLRFAGAGSQRPRVSAISRMILA